MKKGLVFAGGGSKGAYQIGAWKALNELGEEFDVAAGTSIGSINAAFYVQHDFLAAYGMWQQITAGTIMGNGFNFEKSFNAIYSQREQIRSFVKTYVNSKGADVGPFHESLRRYFDAGKFSSSEVDFALMTVRYPQFEPREVSKQEIIGRGEDGWQWLAASAAAWPVFPFMEVDGERYIDGGYYDNIPVAAAFKLGAERVTVVDLKTDQLHQGYVSHPYVTYIRPTRDLGTFLNFDKSVIDRSIRLGYNDTMKRFDRFYGRLFTFTTQSEDERRDFSAFATRFLDVLTFLEARHSYFDSVHFRRVNTVEGATTLLRKNAYEQRDDAVALCAAALEEFVRALGFTDARDYPLAELMGTLRSSVRLENTVDDFTGENGDRNIRDYLFSEYNENLSDLKALADDRFLLIARAIAAALASDV